MRLSVSLKLSFTQPTNKIIKKLLCGKYAVNIMQIERGQNLKVGKILRTIFTQKYQKTKAE